MRRGFGFGNGAKKARIFGAVLLTAGVALGAYSYYYTDTFATINSANWYINTTGGGFSGGSNGLNGFGAVISKLAVPGAQPTYYEIRSVLKLGASGGWYVQYLRASNDTIGGIQGSHYHVELANPTFSEAAIREPARHRSTSTSA